MSDRNDWNRQTIEAFRANGGKVGGMWEGRPLLLLTTTGAKSGQRRTNPVMYMRDGDRLLVFASKGGAPTNPDWYHNLLAHPEVTAEVGGETYDAIATPLTGEERDQLSEKYNSQDSGGCTGTAQRLDLSTLRSFLEATVRVRTSPSN